MYRLSPLLVLLATALAHYSDGDLDSVIKQIQERAAKRNTSTLLPKNGNHYGSPAPVRSTPSLSLEEAIREIQAMYPHQAGGNSYRNPSSSRTTVQPVTYRNPSASQTTVQPDTYNIQACVNDKNETGVCVPFYQCSNITNTVIDDGTILIDLRSVGACRSYLELCCLPPERISPPPPTKLRAGCGWHNERGVGFSITGATAGEAAFGEFPWMVAVFKDQNYDVNSPDDIGLYAFIGGGSLIHPSIVLTAAHILKDAPAAALKIRAGEWDTQTQNEMYPYQETRVAEAVVHQEFNKGNAHNDIALLFLASPVSLAPHVGVACLPQPRALAPDGARCLACGWGKNEFGDNGSYQVILKRVEIPVVNHQHCSQLYRRTRLGLFYILHSSFMCAGEIGKDTCKGDGGSPLVCPSESASARYIQHGIVSWGLGCGGETPGVYADVGVLRAWVDGHVLSRGFDPAVYTAD